ncbi:MAG TPA: hypothetical protein VF765_32720 [Polyangiaceae bacterium]
MRFPLSSSIGAIFFVLTIGFSTAAWADDDAGSTSDTTETGPHRHGFTLELGIGVGGTDVSYGSNSAGPRYGGGGPGLSGLSLSLGGYITPDIAIVARAAGTSYWSDFGQGTKQIVSGVYGASVIGWIGDFYLSGGPGLAVFVPADAVSVDLMEGFGLDLRAGYAFLDTKHNALTLGLEALPAFYSGTTVVGGALNFEWHYF